MAGVAFPPETPMLLLPLLFACSSEPPAPELPPVENHEIAAAAASSLCDAAAQASVECTHEAGVATVAGHQLAVDVSNRTFMTFEPTTIGRGDDAEVIPGEAQLSALVVLKADDQALFHSEPSHSAGHADLAQARAAVLDELAQHWVVTHGSAALDAAAGDPEAPVLSALGLNIPAAAHGELHAWAGYPVLRGRGFDPKIANKMGPSVASMLAALGPFVEGLKPEGLHAVQVKARLGGGGAPGPCGIIPPLAMTPGATTSIVALAGEVLVDGVAKGDICALSEPVSWPLPPEGAVLEWDQIFVLGQAAAAIPVEVLEGGDRGLDL